MWTLVYKVYKLSHLYSYEIRELKVACFIQTIDQKEKIMKNFRTKKNEKL